MVIYVEKGVYNVLLKHWDIVCIYSFSLNEETLVKIVY